MEFQCRPCNWQYSYQEEGMEELRHSLVYTNLELETTVLSAREEIRRREYELVQLEFLLNKTMKERDEEQAKCSKLMLDKLVLQQQLQQKQQQKKQEVQPNQVDAPPLSGTYSSEDESSKDASGFNKQTSLAADPCHQSPIPDEALALGLLGGKSLPEKGKLLQAVMEAGPLLQTLLLAGPLPQWQHPPPPLNATEIPPVTISSPTPCLIHQDSFNRTSNATFLSKKRVLEDPDSSLNNKYQKIVLQ